jgi:16S rRNA (cytidine1402-2'-O)-methyltransferase
MWAARDSIIALHQGQARSLQMAQGTVFGNLPRLCGLRTPPRHHCLPPTVNPWPPIIAQAAAAAAGDQQHPAGALYIVATPIGNLADLTLRAIHVLGLVDAVACEDTRVTGALLAKLGLHKPLQALHEHNERSASAAVLERLARGERVAYVSDAGTPAVSDPGAALVAAVRVAGHSVMPVPGASSVITAVSAAGDTAAQGFLFAGFLSPKASERDTQLAALAQERGRSVVLFEAPHRIEALLKALVHAMPERRLTLARELTKQFESITTLAAADAPEWLTADANRSRGEFVLVLHAMPAVEPSDTALPADAERVLQLLLAELPLKQAVALAAAVTQAPRNALYDRALALKN